MKKILWAITAFFLCFIFLAPNISFSPVKESTNKNLNLKNMQTVLWTEDGKYDLSTLKPLYFNLNAYDITPEKIGKDTFYYVKSALDDITTLDYEIGPIAYSISEENKVTIPQKTIVKASKYSDNVVGSFEIIIDQGDTIASLPRSGNHELASLTFQKLLLILERDYFHYKPVLNTHYSFTEDDFYGSWTLKILEPWDQLILNGVFSFQVTSEPPKIDKVDISSLTLNVDILENLEIVKIRINSLINDLLQQNNVKEVALENMDYIVIGDTLGQYSKIQVSSKTTSKILTEDFSVDILKKDLQKVQLEKFSPIFSDSEIQEKISNAILNLFNTSPYRFTPEFGTHYNVSFTEKNTSISETTQFLVINPINEGLKYLANSKEVLFAKIDIQEILSQVTIQPTKDLQVVRTTITDSLKGPFSQGANLSRTPIEGKDYEIVFTTSTYGVDASIKAIANSIIFKGNYNIFVSYTDDGNGGDNGNGGNGGNGGDNGNGENPIDPNFEKIDLLQLDFSRIHTRWISTYDALYKEIQKIINDEIERLYGAGAKIKDTNWRLEIDYDDIDTTENLTKTGHVWFHAKPTSPHLKNWNFANYRYYK